MRPPLTLSSPSSPSIPYHSPFQGYVHSSPIMNEKPPGDSPLDIRSADSKERLSALPTSPIFLAHPLSPQSRCGHHHLPTTPSPPPPRLARHPSPLLLPTHVRCRSSSAQLYTRPRGLRIANLLRPWVPLILYGLTSLAFVVAIAFWKTAVFTRLDQLSHWLQVEDHYGQAVLFALIFLTTFPPIPLYSTLIILSGYTFGAWPAAVLSYFAALTGALTVFIISRTLYRDTILRWLDSTTTIKRVVRAIEKRPKLLFLIRLAPYPYNVMNCLLAASPTLTLRTYTICTALSLFKVIIHTSLGASIHSFKDYHGAPGTGEEETGANTVARTWTVIGIALCIAIFIYLAVVARRAVDEELVDEPLSTRDCEETISFLPEADVAESPLRSHPFAIPSGP